MTTGDVAAPHAHDHDAVQSRPLWLATITAVVAICWTGAIGTCLGAIGQYHVWLVVTAAVFATAASIVPIARSIDRGTSDRWAPVALAIVLASFAWNLTNLSEHVVIDRDPGSYASTAKWLASHGDLRVQLTNQVVADVPGLHLSGPAAYPVTATTVEFQFNHAAAAVFAVGTPVGDGWGLFAMPAAVGSVGLLAVYLALRRLCRYGGVAVAAITAIAVSQPYLYVARDTYSETFVLATLWTGLATLLWIAPAPATSRRTPYVLLGALFGATALFRVDAGLYLIAMIVACAILRIGGHALKRVLLVVAAALPPVALGALDARFLAGNYLHDLWSQVRTLAAVEIIALCALFAFELLRVPDRSLGERLRAGFSNRVARVAAVAAAAAFAVMWLVRPAVSKARGGWNDDAAEALHLEGVQRSLGLAIEPWRSYGEQSLAQFGWYLGVPLMVAALAGVTVLVFRAVRTPTGPFGLLTLMVLIGAPYYLWNPSITPDHLWSTRRYMPFILPAVAACAAIGVEAGATALRHHRWMRGGRAPAFAAAVAAIGFVVPTVWTTWPVRDMAAHRNWRGALESACDQMGANAVIVTVGFDSIAMPMRAWCGAEVMSTSKEEAPAVLAAVRDRSYAACQRVYVISRETPDDGGFADFVALIGAYHGFSFTTPEFTVGRPPDSYRGDNLAVLVSWIPLAEPCIPAT